MRSQTRRGNRDSLGSGLTGKEIINIRHGDACNWAVGAGGWRRRTCWKGQAAPPHTHMTNHQFGKRSPDICMLPWPMVSTEYILHLWNLTDRSFWTMDLTSWVLCTSNSRRMWWGWVGVWREETPATSFMFWMFRHSHTGHQVTGRRKRRANGRPKCPLLHWSSSTRHWLIPLAKFLLDDYEHLQDSF
jgi:hypothetical protein